MADGFEEMIGVAQPFFKGLHAHNDKNWFEERKDHYINDIRKPAELLATLFAEDLSRLTGRSQTPKVFRIYRDVRFSKDKSPYNPHLHILWSAEPPNAAGWFFSVDPVEIWFGMGLLGLTGERLNRYRHFVDQQGDKLRAILDGLADSHGSAISDYGPEPLKRVPKPFDPAHPHGDLLRRKGFALGASLSDDWRSSGLLKRMNETAKAYRPLWSLIHEHL